MPPAGRTRLKRSALFSAVQTSPPSSNNNEVMDLDAEDTDVVETDGRIRDPKHSLLMRNQLNNSRFSSRRRQVPHQVQHHHNHSSLSVALPP
jgi:hypothetical protein